MTYAKSSTDSLSTIFAALADPTRRGIFDDLRDHPQSVSELAEVRPVSRPAVSQHLRVLEKAELVFAVPKGSHRIYAVRPEGLDALRSYLDQMWDQALAAYATAISRQNEKH